VGDARQELVALRQEILLKVRRTGSFGRNARIVEAPLQGEALLAFTAS